MAQPSERFGRLAEIFSGATGRSPQITSRQLVEDPIVANRLMEFDERTLFLAAALHPSRPNVHPRDWLHAAERRRAREHGHDGSNG